MLDIKSRQNFWAGAFFLLFGALEVFVAFQYEIGSATEMGPGYMPVLLGYSLIGLGLIVLCGSLAVAGPDIESGHWRPFVFIISALLLFAFLINIIGLALSTMLVVLVGGCGHRGHIRWGWLLVLAVCMAIFTVLLFVKLLGQPIPAWWGIA